MDTVERVARDPQRKVGWYDRLVGTMRLALSEGIVPRRFAIGAAAAFAALSEDVLDDRVPIANLALSLWSAAHREHTEQQNVLALVEAAARFLRTWRNSGFPDLHQFFRNAS
jgi:mannitol-1-phosphate/altronate dehydrogenase